jgi:hypothetical protein
MLPGGRTRGSGPTSASTAREFGHGSPSGKNLRACISQARHLATLDCCHIDSGDDVMFDLVLKSVDPNAVRL